MFLYMIYADESNNFKIRYFISFSFFFTATNENPTTHSLIITSSFNYKEKKNNSTNEERPMAKKIKICLPVRENEIHVGTKKKKIVKNSTPRELRYSTRQRYTVF